MRVIRNLNIGKKLYGGFALVLAVLIALSILSYSNFDKQNDTTEWNEHTYDVLMELQSVLASMVDMETGQRGFSLTGNEKSLEPYNAGKTSFGQHLATVKQLTSDNPKQQELMGKLEAEQKAWQETAESAIELRKRVEAGSATMNEVVLNEQAEKGKASFDRFRAVLAESKSMEQGLLAERSAANESRKTFTNMSIIVGTLIAVVLAAIIAFIIARLITRPIYEVNEAAKAIAAGDLNVDFEVRSTDEMGQLSKSFREMVGSMNDVLANISISAEQVASGSRQVSDSSMALSQGATEQASSIEELTASLEEIGSQTNMNAQRATEANSLAESVKVKAVEGDDQMKSMLRSMEEINEASGNISKIIKVIDEIAFQTNILALNAAVEAARAGQHGKGFAVVAEEVRNLAARSASAAKETTDLIEGSIKKVEGGTRIANETASALNEIVGGVSKVAELVDQIASASNEQASGIGQVNQAIFQVSQVTQTNSATSEETASASEQLSGQAENLKRQVARFNLKKNARQGLYRAEEEMSPEVRQMLERFSGKDSFSDPSRTNSSVESPRKKIVLSDQEFGKY
ncbi:MAG: CHASE3 domain-containing protein [Cohnella sp.]|nr:CHASE3 domain-containing protein [Cohnella sp.]